MKDIYIIGDSNTMFLSRDNDAIQNIKKCVLPDHGQYILNHDGYSIYLYYHFGKTAYNVSHAISNIGDIDISPNSRLYFQFGTCDSLDMLNKYNNHQEVVQRYVQACIKFSQKYQIKPRFLQPFSNNKFTKNLDKFYEALKDECAKNHLEAPIEIYGKIIDRNYESEPWDDRWHMTYSDNERLLNYLVSIA